MMSPKVTWTLLNEPRATVVKGDNCVVGPENKVNQNFRSRGLERKESLEVSRTETPKPEVSKSQNLQRKKNVAYFKGDSCVVGPESKETKFSEFRD
jgi:hypothetical protein